MGSISESGISRWAAVASIGLFALACAAMLLLASSARAAEVIYWDNYDGATVSTANIDGSGGGPVNLAGVTLDKPEGMAYDTPVNRLLIANSEGGAGKQGQIVYVNLDGSGAGVLSTPGAPVEDPEGIAVDPATGIVYWVNTKGPSSIGWAHIDGSGGGTLNTSGATLESPYKIAVDPAAGRVYWANTPSGSNGISFANANNSGGGGNLSLAGATAPAEITALVVDPAGNRIYWLDQNGGGFLCSLVRRGGRRRQLDGCSFRRILRPCL